MYKLFALSTMMLASAAFAADMMGTWRLNTAQSKYVGMPAPKEMTLTYTPEGSGWHSESSGTSGSGEAVKSTFTYVKDGAEISTTGYPYWDTLVIRNGKEAKGSATMMRGGKKVGTVTRTIASDGKTMTISGNVMTPEGKKASFVSVYDKQ